jgi:hypothetical protein
VATIKKNMNVGRIPMRGLAGGLLGVVLALTSASQGSALVPYYNGKTNRLIISVGGAGGFGE